MGKLESVSGITYIICRGQHRMKMCCNSRALTLVLGPSKRGALNDCMGHMPMKLVLSIKEPGA